MQQEKERSRKRQYTDLKTVEIHKKKVDVKTISNQTRRRNVRQRERPKNDKND